MADKLTVIPVETPEVSTPSVDAKDRQITRSWSVQNEEVFTIRQVENEIAMVDEQIASLTTRKEELEAKVASATAAVEAE